MTQTVLHSFILVPSRWRVLPSTLPSQTDMPSLTTVTLNKENAFDYKKTVHTKSLSSSSPSFLDITPALQQYLSFPLTSTHDSPSILSKRVILISLPSPSSHHTHPQFPIMECVRMCHSIIPLHLFYFPPQLYKSHNFHTLTPKGERITNSAS